jgi:hypothetical protein
MGAMRQAMTAENVGFGRAATVKTRHVCVACRERRSLFLYHGVVKADADHTLCFRCYRSLQDRIRANEMGAWFWKNKTKAAS